MPHNCRIFSFYLFNRLLQALAYLTYKGQLFDKVWKYTAYNGSDGACSNSLIQSQMSAGKSSLMIQTASGKGTYTAYSAASNSESDLMAVSVWHGERGRGNGWRICEQRPHGSDCERGGGRDRESPGMAAANTSEQ